MTGRRFQRTYEIVAGPAPEAFETYAARIHSDLRQFLAAEPDELAVQSFFEQNPSLVPGPRSLNAPSAYPMNSLLISQPELPGLRKRIPDFMWISFNSVAVYPTFIEIERPAKKLFTSQRVPSAEFSQARHQLTQWRGWFSRPENVQKFIGDYGISTLADRRIFEPRFILLYGRRSEFEGDHELERERAHLLTDPTESLLSYDRIVPDPILHNTITVRAIGNGRFRAIATPPTFTLGPVDAERLPLIEGLEAVLEATLSISPQRRDFLVKRLDYWRNWAQIEDGGIISTGDRE